MPDGEVTKKRVFVIEDDNVYRELLVFALSSQGYSVFVADNGARAVQLIENADPHIILLDMLMPVMDGLEATRHIREQEKETGLHLPIIALTAHAMPDDREKCLRAGMDDYVSKPVRRQELYAALEAFFPKDEANTTSPSAC